ncbi:HPr-rel-A system PqqD family peptide chaperone [Roseateles chitinivorans]|uniref:HPr-rel-A system PqqD family peptide chaperone n=1 Tax=Roseateles chitinivorans TaxID=2917965 RepID=UPI003D66EB84
MAGAAWRCRQPLADVLLAWEGEQHAVYFDPDSGDTHLIAALGAQLAEWLAAEPLDRDQLLARLARDVDWDEPPRPTPSPNCWTCICAAWPTSTC